MASLSRGVRALPFAIAAVAVVVRVDVALVSHRALIAASVFQDDAFYYLVIARNWLAGLGPTFDGETATNAFHPLFMAFVLPVVAASGDDPALPVHALGVVLAVVAGGSVLLAYGLVRAWVAGGGDGGAPGVAPDVAAAVAAAFVALSPYFVVHGTNGQETGLSILFGLALLRVEQRWLAPAAAPRWREAVLFGVVAALAVLARSDLSLLVASIGVVWLARALRRGALGSAAPRALLAAGVAVALWLPWGVASRALTGAWLPTSGAASREIALNFGWLNLRPVWQPERARRERFFDTDDVPVAWTADVATELLFVQLLEQPLLAPARATLPYRPWPQLRQYGPYRAFVSSPVPGAVVVLFVLTGAAWAVRRLSSAAGAAPNRASPAATIALFWLAMFAGYALYAPMYWYFPRYACLPVLLAMAAGVASTARVTRGRAGRRTAALAVGLALLAFQAFQLASWREMRLVPDRPGGFLRAWESLAPSIPDGAKVAAFQSGVYGWFGDRPIVNLDGKVNADAQRALAEHRLHAYATSRGIEYVLDWEPLVRALLLRHVPAVEREGFALDEVLREPGPNPVVLYHLRSRGGHGARSGS